MPMDENLVENSVMKYWSCFIVLLRTMYYYTNQNNNHNSTTNMNYSTKLKIIQYTLRGISVMSFNQWNGTFKKCKQWFEYQHLLLLRDIWWSKL
jgi:hypothetical protein